MTGCLAPEPEPELIEASHEAVVERVLELQRFLDPRLFDVPKLTRLGEWTLRATRSVNSFLELCDTLTRTSMDAADDAPSDPPAPEGDR